MGGIESGRVQEGACKPRSSGNERSQGGGKVHCPWLGDVEVEDEASDKSWQEGDVRADSRGESQASQDDCQGFRGGSAEEGRLSSILKRACACGSPHEASRRAGERSCNSACHRCEAKKK